MDELIPWFSLKSVPGLGNHTFKRLITAFGDPESVLAASRNELLQTEGLSETIADAIIAHETPDTVRQNIDNCLARDITIVPMTDDRYPALLLEIPDPPPYLYVYGDLTPRAGCIAIVGSRSPTRYGLSMAKQLSADLASQGLCIVSGMARGIDTAAHQGALAASGQTVAVLGSGLANLYPAENEPLAENISKNGAVISEFPIFSPPEAFHFPQRNRIISGMCLGTIVVEAAQKSGSLITARLAAEQNRDVFAVPGSIQSFKSTGAHGLLKQGARLVESAADVMAEIGHLLRPGQCPPEVEENSRPRPPAPAKQSPDILGLDRDEQLVLQTLEPYPVHIDEIGQQLAMEPGKVAAILLQLELKGLVNQQAGKRFQLNEAPSG
ncbi:MAG: DNA-processing protein DprA [Thermodesulfobacteriota bacterium]|nr:DNA-processing protein DprA [Thermodesulfobacteriota bacterium]